MDVGCLSDDAAGSMPGASKLEIASPVDANVLPVDACDNVDTDDEKDVPDFGDSDQEEDVPHIPAHNLSAQQRRRREVRLAAEERDRRRAQLVAEADIAREVKVREPVVFDNSLLDKVEPGDHDHLLRAVGIGPNGCVSTGC